MNWLCLSNFNTLFSNYSSNKRLITLSSDPVSSFELRVKGFGGFREFFACIGSSEIWFDIIPFLHTKYKKIEKAKEEKEDLDLHLLSPCSNFRL